MAHLARGVPYAEYPCFNSEPFAALFSFHPLGCSSPARVTVVTDREHRRSVEIALSTRPRVKPYANRLSFRAASR